jgi:hypothetical protein
MEIGSGVSLLLEPGTELPCVPVRISPVAVRWQYVLRLGVSDQRNRRSWRSKTLSVSVASMCQVRSWCLVASGSP